jgi:hypothetical protein
VIKNLQRWTIASGLILISFTSGLLAQTKFISATEDYSNLKITEISYHPLDVINGTDTTDGKDLEFIEFKNIGDSPINLTGLVLDSAVYYEFPNDVMLGPKQFWVVASKPSKFFAFYGMEASGNFSGNLANSGDEILLRDALGNPVIHFIYDDKAPWPEDADGSGFTLVSTYFNPTGNPADEAYWRASIKLYGSPFKDDDGQVDVVNNKMLSDLKLNIFPNPTHDYIVVSLGNESFSDNLAVKIFTVNGSLVYQTTINNNDPVNLTKLGIQSGLYYIQVETNNLIETKKFLYFR